MLEKGFLGPIGDDLPSLIPLLFALLVFFGTFSFAFGVFNEENNYFDGDLAILNISRILKGTSYIIGFKDFEKKCASINITNIKYRAGITNYFTALDNYEDQRYPTNPQPRSYSIGFFKNDAGDVFECPDPLGSSTKPDFSDVSSPSIIDDLDEYFEGRTVITKIYPLVVEDNKVVKPMHLVVTAWR